MLFPVPARMRIVEVFVQVHVLLTEWEARQRAFANAVGRHDTPDAPSSLDDASQVVLARLRGLVSAMQRVDDDDLATVGLLGPELDLKISSFDAAVASERHNDALRIAAIVVGAVGRIPGLGALATPVDDYLSILPSTAQLTTGGR